MIQVRDGAYVAYNRFFSNVYDELKEIDMRQINYERPEHTLAKTDLVHAVFSNMIGKDRIDWKNRSHF